MRPAQLLTEQVRHVDANNIALPVLRELVKEIQARTPDEIREGAQYWSDTNWKQWREHTSHNPW